MSSTRGRQVVLILTNKSGGSVAAGDVVIVDTANDTAFTTTTTARSETSLGVAQETIASNATGRVLVQGYASLVNVPASVTRGHYIETHTVAKQATGNSTRRSGSFGQFLTGGTTPTALIWSKPDQTATASAAAFSGCKAYNSTTQNVNNTAAALTLDTEDYDTDAYHSTVTNTSRMTVPTGKDGKFLLQAGTFASASTDFCYFKKNGTTIIRGGQTFARSAAGYQQAQTVTALVATDYVEFFVSNTSSINYGHATALDAQTWFAITFLGA